MSDTNSGDDKTLSVTPKKTLTLKRPGIEQSTVRQNFSHGRTKQVVVETKRKFVKPGEQQPAPAPQTMFTPKPAAPQPQPPQPQVQAQPQQVQPQPRPQQAAPVVQEQRRPTPPPQPDRGGMVLNELSRGEMEARRRALEGSQAREMEDRQRAAEDAKRRADEEERRKREREDSARRQAEEEARIKPRPKHVAVPRKRHAVARRRLPSRQGVTRRKKPSRVTVVVLRRLLCRRAVSRRLSWRVRPSRPRPRKIAVAASSRSIRRCLRKMVMRVRARCRPCVVGRRSSSARCTMSRARKSCVK